MNSGLTAEPGNVEAFIYPDEGEHESNLDVDKAWHGIHFLLACSFWAVDSPLANVVLTIWMLLRTDSQC